MTDQEFDDMWAKCKEHDRLEKEKWLALPKEERERIKKQSVAFRSWENLTDDNEAKPLSSETPTDRHPAAQPPQK